MHDDTHTSRSADGTKGDNNPTARADSTRAPSVVFLPPCEIDPEPGELADLEAAGVAKDQRQCVSALAWLGVFAVFGVFVALLALALAWLRGN